MKLAGGAWGRTDPARGFTLLEMLVTLALFSMISVLLWQAMAWMVRIESSLTEARAFSTQRALQLEWVRHLLSGAVSGPLGDPRQYQGEAARIAAYSVDSPWPNQAGPVWLELVLQQQDGETTLQAMPVASVPASLFGTSPERLAAERAPLVLLRWEGQGSFSFLDVRGTWHPNWPPGEGQLAGGVAPMTASLGTQISADEAEPELPGRLPRAVKLTGLPEGELSVILAAEVLPQPSRRNLLEAE